MKRKTVTAVKMNVVVVSLKVNLLAIITNVSPNLGFAMATMIVVEVKMSCLFIAHIEFLQIQNQGKSLLQTL